MPLEYSIIHYLKIYILFLRYHFKMTSENNLQETLEKTLFILEEICEHTRAIRRVVNRILDHLHQEDAQDDFDPDQLSWEDMDNNDDMYL